MVPEWDTPVCQRYKISIYDRSTDSLESYTVAGYDLFIYVYDGTTLVGPKTLTVIVTGTFMKDFMD